jgi:hypothetical protein
VTGNCESCHKSTSTWSSAKVDHSHLQRGHQLRVCHNGSGGVTGKNSSHVPVGSTNCFSCHSPTTLEAQQASTTPRSPSRPSAPPATPAATSRPMARAANHVPYQLVGATSSANCDTCHKSGYAAWTGAKVHSNANITTQCATCHTGAYAPAVGKPSNTTHANVTATARAATSPPATWGGAKVDHSGFNAATNCAHLPQRQSDDRQVRHPRARSA